MNALEKKEAFEVLNYQIRSCERCDLSSSRKHALIGEGSLDARVLFVALSPGVKEDKENRMFIGPSGVVLNRLFYESGIDRKAVFMSNLVKCMLPNNRKPSMNEIELCSEFLEDEISIIQPEIIAPLGYYAVRYIMQKYEEGQMDTAQNGNNFVFGRMISRRGQNIFPLTHPASLLYNPSRKHQTLETYKTLSHFIQHRAAVD